MNLLLNQVETKHKHVQKSDELVSELDLNIVLKYSHKFERPDSNLQV